MLCGRFPFWGKSDIEYMRSLARGPCMEGEGWDEVTDQGKEFLRELLKLDPKERLTAEQALSHPWILKEDPQFNRRLSSVNGMAFLANKLKQKLVIDGKPGEATQKAGGPGKTKSERPEAKRGNVDGETTPVKGVEKDESGRLDEVVDDEESEVFGTKV